MAALLTTKADLDDVRLRMPAGVVAGGVGEGGAVTLRGVRGQGGPAMEERAQFEVSKDRRGLGVKAIELRQDYGSPFDQWFDRHHSIYLLGWACDLSGEKVYQCPTDTDDPDEWRFDMRAGELATFIGAGQMIFPPRAVTGAMLVNVQVWESKADQRAFGETLAKVSEEIRSSKLNDLLTAISVIAGVTAGEVVLIKDAALELGGIVGKVLQETHDHQLDLFAGTFPASEEWEPQEETYSRDDCDLTVHRFS